MRGPLMLLAGALIGILALEFVTSPVVFYVTLLPGFALWFLSGADGVTLIERTVPATIICLLMVLLFPAVQAKRKRASDEQKKIGCFENVPVNVSVALTPPHEVI